MHNATAYTGTVIHDVCTKSNSQAITVKKWDNTSNELGM